MKIITAYDLNVIDYNNVVFVLKSNGQSIPHLDGLYSGNQITWRWTTWQNCDRCGVLGGEKKRFGKCLFASIKQLT